MYLVRRRRAGSFVGYVLILFENASTAIYVITCSKIYLSVFGRVTNEITYFSSYRFLLCLNY